MLSFQNLPMTPYYKLIDYWMMFSMVMLMVTMLVHTYLNKLVRDAKRKGEGERHQQEAVNHIQDLASKGPSINDDHRIGW